MSDSATSPAAATTTTRSDVLWRLWPWMSWIVALFATFHGFLFEGGWESLFLLLFSPIIVPVVGLLESAPRFFLRRRGHRSTPLAVAWVLPLHWAFFIIAVLSVRGSTDSAPTRSGLSILSGQPILASVENAVGSVAALLTIVTGVTLLVLSFALSRPTEEKAPSTPGTASAISGGLALVLVALSPLLAVTATKQMPDASGNRLSAVEAMPLDEQVELLEGRYLEAQRELSVVRGLASDAEWRSAFTMVSSSSWSSTVSDYAITVSFRLDADAGIDAEALDGSLAELGYVRRSYGTGWITPSGGSLSLDTIGDETTLELTTAAWWGDGYELGETVDERVDELTEASYAADEFPALRSAPPAWIVDDWDEILWSRYAPYNYPDLDDDDLDAAGNTRDEGLAAYDAGLQNDRADAARALVADFAARLKLTAAPESGESEGAMFEDKALWENSYATPRSPSDHYAHMVVESFAPPKNPIDWGALAAELGGESWGEISVTGNALAAVHSNGNVVVAYEDEGIVVVAVRTPFWWGVL